MRWNRGSSWRRTRRAFISRKPQRAEGFFDACGGLWIFPPLNEDIYTVSGEDDGYLVSVQGGRKGMIRIMGDSRLRKIVAALLIPCEYDEIFQRGEDRLYQGWKRIQVR